MINNLGKGIGSKEDGEDRNVAKRDGVVLREGMQDKRDGVTLSRTTSLLTL